MGWSEHSFLPSFIGAISAMISFFVVMHIIGKDGKK